MTLAIQACLPADVLWHVTRDGDDACRSLFNRHYSRHTYQDGRAPLLFVGPGEKLVLRSQSGDAMFVWRRFIDHAIPQQVGVNCAVFRNESRRRSSDLIVAAQEVAWKRWPWQRLYTYVNASRTAARRSSKRPPGACFVSAGWRPCGTTQGGLHILEMVP